MRKKLALLAAWIAVAPLVSGCDDPGPNPAAAKAPSAVSDGNRAATLSWDAPTANTNGSALTDLVGYRIYYGSSPEELKQSVQIGTVGLQTYVIDNLDPGTWYFAVMALASNGAESALSNIVAKTIS